MSVKLVLLSFGFILLAEAKNVSIYHCIDTIGQIYQCPNNVPLMELDNTTDVVAYMRYAKRINHTGWDELELVTNPSVDNNLQAYMAGYLEGFVTADLTASFLYNTIPHLDRWCPTYGQFVGENLNASVKNVEMKKDDIYWQEVGLTLYQMAGIDDGYRNRLSNRSVEDGLQVRPHFKVDPCGLIFLNLYTEVNEIDEILKLNEHLKEPEERCSALVKVLPGHADVLVAHSTWSSPKTMLRILKRYVFNYSTSRAKSVTMSSYPGNIFSTDDFYITGQNLVVQETSLTNYNPETYEKTQVEDITFEFIRNTVANRLATSGLEWIHYFGLRNSGTYNNQFMILDYKHFRPGFIEPGFLYIAEQMPHMIKFMDATAILKSQSYWASYNVPYFSVIYTETGFDRMYREYGDHFSYKNNVRARIFARDHGRVTNMTTMFHLMRYNNFREDPLSGCECQPGNRSASMAIAARSDLNDPKGNYSIDVGFKAIMAIDAKITSSRLVASEEMIAISGPTSEQVEPFDWNTTKLVDLRYRDQPTLWNFKPVLVRWSTNETFDEYQI